MAQLTGTTATNDLVGIAEDVEDVIFNITPTETPALSMFKRTKVDNTLHQWQTDALAAAATNRFVEGDESTYAAVTPTVMLANYCQISKKTVRISGTADAVRKYGRGEEFAYQIAKKGRELKRDIEYAIVRNQTSSAGSDSVVRSSAGMESMIAGTGAATAGNGIVATGNTTGTTPGYAGAGVWSAPADGTATALDETTFVRALEAAWQDGGDPSVIMMNSALKRKIATFGGASKFAGVSVNQNQGRNTNAVVLGGVDVYVSDFGEHKMMLNRYMRTSVILCVDPDYWKTGWLRPIKYEDRAKTGDAQQGELLCEWTLIASNPDASAKVADAS